MQYIIRAPDKKDNLSARLAVRDDHVAMWDQFVKEKKHLYGMATLDADWQMNGSVLVVEFETMEDLQAWLENEPYITWWVRDMDELKIIPCKVGPSFIS